MLKKKTSTNFMDIYDRKHSDIHGKKPDVDYDNGGKKSNAINGNLLYIFTDGKCVFSSWVILRMWVKGKKKNKCKNGDGKDVAGFSIVTIGQVGKWQKKKSMESVRPPQA